MKQHPILFSTEMVQAILAGRKTITRRIIKPQPVECKHQDYIEASWRNDPPNWKVGVYKNGYDYYNCALCGNGAEQAGLGYKFPYGRVGGIIWVRETYRKYYHVDEHGYTHFDDMRYDYAADKPEPIYMRDADGWQVFNKDGTERMIPWKSGRYMPKEACRIWLKVTNITVERLQDIKVRDAVKEGVEYWNIDHLEGGELVADYKNYMWRDDETYEDYHFPTYADAISSFKSLWESINGALSWLQNPWVWVIEFEKTQKP